METKKSPKVDLENKKLIFFLFGLVISLFIVFLCINYKSQQQKINSLGDVTTQLVEEEIIPITREQEIKPPPPPPLKVIEILNIVDNDIEIEEDVKLYDSEADENTLITATPIIIVKEEQEEKDTEIFYIVEDMPEFPGGENALRVFLGNSIKYPVIAQENGIQGKVYVTFVVGKDGSVYNAVIARGVDPALDKEALRVVNSQPKWKPGKQRGKPVNVSYTVPINFVLQ